MTPARWWSVALVLAGCGASHAPTTRDAAATDDGRDVVAAGDGCVGALRAYHSFSWEGGIAGGERARVELVPPARVRQVFPACRDGAPCDVTLPPCGDGATLGAAEVQAALDHPDLAAAYRMHIASYGRLAPDGDEFVLRHDEHAIRVAGPCPPGAPGCVPVPDGIARMVAVLTRVRDQALRSAACAARCP